MQQDDHRLAADDDEICCPEFCCLCGSDGDAERGLKTQSSLLTERIARLASLVNRCTHHRSGTNPSFTESRNTRMSMLRVGDGVIL